MPLEHPNDMSKPSDAHTSASGELHVLTIVSIVEETSYRCHADRLNGPIEPSEAIDHQDAMVDGVGQQLQAGLVLTESDPPDDAPDYIFQLTVNLPHEPHKTQVMVSTQEQVQDVRQSIVDFPGAFQYSCFHLEHQGKRINDFIPLSEIEGFTSRPEVTLVEDPYTDKDARVHVVRVRELIGSLGDRVDTAYGVLAGSTLFDSVMPAPGRTSKAVPNGVSEATAGHENAHPMVGYEFEAPGTLRSLLPPIVDHPPKVVKALSLSMWNPPPYAFRQKGHLLYLQLTTLEGEQHQITSAVWGFFTNRCSSTNFDPLPRPHSRNAAAHSLLSLISQLSPSFSASFDALQEFHNQRDPLATFQPPNAIPASPWLVPSSNSPLCAHLPDLARTQESYLASGIENAETLRDWNEELQSTRELPRETVQERVFKERLTSKLFADYNEAAVRGAVLVARGEVPALNPTENITGQIYLYNNVFLSFGADGAGTFASDGADEAARVAAGKDVAGVKAVNQLDIHGLFTPGTVVVDYLGQRIVGQSIVPGIFKQRDSGDHQIDYGGVEGKDVIANHAAFVPLFEKMSQAMKVKRHPVWDKEGKKHDLESSVETKGLLGTDGRKYVLDLYRITPLDIGWIEKHCREPGVTNGRALESKIQDASPSYPHRMSVLRPELVEAFYKTKLRDYVSEELDRRRASADPEGGASESHGTQTSMSDDKAISTQVPADAHNSSSEEQQQDQPESAQEHVDISGFQFALNPDVFNGQRPETAEDIAQWSQDERDVRAASDFLVSDVIPQLVHDLSEGDVGFPMDGRSLTRLLHRRGINVRYLGAVCDKASEVGPRLWALKEIAEREMISRGFKHAAIQQLRSLPTPFAASCISHLLNCLLWTESNQTPVPEVDETLKALFATSNLQYLKVTARSFQKDVETEVLSRFRYSLNRGWVSEIQHVQLTREIALKLGLQLEAKSYCFGSCQMSNGAHVEPVNDKLKSLATNGHFSNGKKKKKNGDYASASDSRGNDTQKPALTFTPDNIINFVPVVKEASPKSLLAEETFEAGRISFAQGQKEIGQELLLESLSLHEQIYGILHPEVSRFYSQLSMFYYQLEEKATAAEIARKAVMVSERTLGVDCAETILCYLNLGLFEHSTGNTKAALTYMRHALELWKVIYGPNHPDAITTTNNVAVMLQHLKHYHDSRLWFEASLQISEPMYGGQSLNTGTLLFQLAQALALDHDSKAAVHRIREAYNIFLNVLGPNHKNTKEAEGWLEQLTQNAVSIAKHAKDLQARKFRRVYLGPRVTLGTRPQLGAGQSSSEAVNGSQSGSSMTLDSRNIDELLQFIEGVKPTTGKTREKNRPGRTTPRRKGGLVL